MKILSYNVLCHGGKGHDWSDRKEAVIQTVRNYLPDVFGIQEAHYNWMKVFVRNMPEYDYVGVGRDDGKKDGEFSPVFYRKDKFDLIDSGWFWISETPDKPSLGWDAWCNRICSYAKLKGKDDRKVFVAMNTHLDHVSEKARSEGVKMINERAADFGCPTFVTGDFNILEGTGCYVDMIKPKLFKDSKFLAPVLENTYTFHPFFHHNEPYAIIDFIFVTDGIKVKNYHVIEDKVDGAYPSDHCPVIIDVDLEN